MAEALTLIDAHVEGPFLLGGKMTVVDIDLAIFLIWYRSDAETPRLSRIADAVRHHPIWRRHYGDR
ncbi:MAG: glutathione S-transferase C-terminal domain-containing protein [Alphaproteobacteria bacterium]|nr:glutathione S-transferase C-terminal domain-containing protein [Alphaproteobacteria bacterium]